MDFAPRLTDAAALYQGPRRFVGVERPAPQPATEPTNSTALVARPCHQTVAGLPAKA